MQKLGVSSRLRVCEKVMFSRACSAAETSLNVDVLHVHV